MRLNSLAFSLRASECPGDPWLFGNSGYMVYATFVPILLVVQFLLKRFAAAANIIDNDEEDFAKEWAAVRSSVGNMFASAKTLLGEHKVQAPLPDKKKKGE